MTTSERIEKAAQSELLKGLARIFAIFFSVIIGPIFVGLVTMTLFRLSAQADTMLGLQLSLRDLTNAVAGLQAQAGQAQQTVANNQKAADDRRDKVDTRFSEQGASIGALSARSDQTATDLRRLTEQVASMAPVLDNVRSDQRLMQQTLTRIEGQLVPSTTVLPGDPTRRR